MMALRACIQSPCKKRGDGLPEQHLSGRSRIALISVAWRFKSTLSKSWFDLMAIFKMGFTHLSANQLLLGYLGELVI